MSLGSFQSDNTYVPSVSIGAMFCYLHKMIYCRIFICLGVYLFVEKYFLPNNLVQQFKTYFFIKFQNFISQLNNLNQCSLRIYLMVDINQWDFENSVVKKLNNMSEIRKISHKKDFKIRKVKFNKKSIAEQHNLVQSIDFNAEVFESSQFQFQDQILFITSEVSNSHVIGFITQAYETNLKDYYANKKLPEKQVRDIIHQVIKSIYSIYQESYPIKQIRPQHFVLIEKSWKMESLVFSNQLILSQQFTSEYMWDTQYQSPQYYSGKQCSDEDFQKMVVWNIGSLILDLYLGYHKLKNTNKFNSKAQNISLEQLQLSSSILSKMSQQMQQKLSKLLHPNPEKRMSLKEVFEDKFLAPEVAELFVQEQWDFPSISQQSMRIKKLMKEVSENQNNSEKHAILLYKCYFQSSIFLQQCQQIFNKITFKKVNTQEIKLLCTYALVLVSLINLHSLQQCLEKQINILSVEENFFKIFINSDESKKFEEAIKLKIKENIQKLNVVKESFNRTEKLIIQKKPQINDFIKVDYKQTNFQDIKHEYRYIMKIAFDAAYSEYLENNTKENAQKTFMTTYCVAFDKMYIKEEIPDNFKFYFEWIREEAQRFYVSSQKLKEYFQNAPYRTLSNHSKFIITKYYKF